jgi:hypothetical protein
MLPSDMTPSRLRDWATGDYCLGANDKENARRIAALAAEVLRLSGESPARCSVTDETVADALFAAIAPRRTP